MHFLKSLRTAVMAVAVSVTALSVPFSANAMTTSEAQAITQRIVTEVTAYVDSDISLQDKQSAFKATMSSYADMDTIARYALGATWRTATPAQQTAFVAAFDDYIAAKYGAQFSNYQGETIAVGEARDLGDRGIVVNTTVTGSSGRALDVQWQFSDRSGSPLLIDIVAEGISLLTSERQAIAGMLDRRRGNIDQLIADLPTGN